MSKPLNIGSLRIEVPEHSTEVGRALDALQNAYEAGKVKTLFVVYASDNGISSAVAGNAMTIPFTALAASAISDRILGDITDSLAGYSDEPEDD
jgi:hypothetical protein